MILTTIVEIIPNKSFRWIYAPELQRFEKKEFKHRFMEDRAFDGIYGRIDGYGTPPNHHLDVIVITNKKVDYGDIVIGKLVGAFRRCDGDHKLICIDSERVEEDIEELKDNEKNMIFRTYEGKYDGDAWVGKEEALALLNNCSTR